MESTHREHAVKGFRLSPEQRRLWRQAGGDPAFWAQCSVLLEGELDREGLRDAAAGVVALHEVLRTHFRRRAGVEIPFQVIADRGELAWRDIDLREWHGEEQRRKGSEVGREDRRQPLDLENGPLLRISLLTLAETRHHLILTLPALCADPATLTNLVSEIGASYGARLLGHKWTAERLQYADLSEALAAVLEDAEMEAGSRFWRDRGVARPVEACLLFEPPAFRGSDFVPEVCTVDLSAAQTARIGQRARQLGASGENFLLTCWRILLCRFADQFDLPVGAAFANRSYEGVEEALGLFAKYLPIDSRLRREQPLAEALRDVQALTEEFSAWQEFFSWEAIEEATGKRGGPVLVPFLFESFDIPPAVETGGITFALEDLASHHDRFKLKLACLNRGDRLRLCLHYNACLYSVADAQRLCRALEVIVEGACADGESTVGVLPMLSGTDRHRMLLALIGANHDEPNGGDCLHEMFAEQASRTPDRTALIVGECRLTYAALDVEANLLAGELLRRGVGSASLVGLCARPSLGMVVGLLGILKAGAAYVPLDPESPPKRLSYQLQDAGISVLVTQLELQDLFPDFTGVFVRLEDRRDPAGQVAVPKGASDPRSLAYAIYTSGSTGSPKGVGVTQGAVTNYTLAICRQLGLETATEEEGLSFAMVSTIGADLGNTCLFASLVSGGCLHVIAHETGTDGARLAAYMARHPIDVLKIVPSHFSLLGVGAELGEVAPRRFLILGGEALSYELLHRLTQAGCQCEVINHYGPTETTVGALTFPVGRAASPPVEAAVSVPIGRPIARMEAYVLDPFLEPVDVGAPAELFLGGPGLARGYLGRPDATAERFIPHPFSARPGARLYRTGDLVRHLASGVLEFLGRIDQQVKIRGFRVEPGEIEATLNSHPGIRQAAVVATGSAPAQRLAAYWVAAQEPAPTLGEIRKFLSERLPDSMVPAQFVLLRALPLTPNGKIDRRALPSPDQTRPDLDKPFVPPRNPVEELLAECWRQILGLEAVGVHDDFFELGGDSIFCVQVAARANQAGLRLSPMEIFRHPTIAELAALAEQAPDGETATEEVQPADAPRSLVSDELRHKVLASLSQLKP
jgi:amino acid adenylation domain-containing protein